MATDSTTAGYLAPVSVLPVNDRLLEDIFGDAIAGITGLDRNNVRPRLQPAPPNLPDQELNWCAFGVSITAQDTFAYVRQIGTLEGGAGQVERDELLDVFISFYGAQSSQLMGRWREGLSIPQNREALWLQGIKLQGLGNPLQVPSLLKDRYVRRMDLTAQFARRVIVSYTVRTIISANGELLTDTGKIPPVPITVNPPNP